MPSDQPNSIRAEALKLYDAHGWFVIPTDPGAKKPYFGFTYKDRYGDNLPSREVVSGWPEWCSPGVRLGARTGAVSGIIVVDVDSEEAHDFIKTKGHPIGPMVQSPREGGGLHLYFKHPDFYIKNAVGFAGIDGLDVRGDYGIVVLPPSPDHKTGRAYEWIISPDDVPVPPCPAWLIDLLKRQSEFKQPIDVPATLAGVPEGKRDTELNRLAGKFRQMNVPLEIAEKMLELAAGKCSPPFNRADAKFKARWIYTHYQPGEDFTPVLNISGLNEKSEEEDFTADALMEEEFPAVKWIVPGLLPEGTMIFAGKPKMGKSWMALGFCIAVATGGRALGEFDTESGAVLYMALEDNKRRLQTRMKELLKSDVVGEDGLHRLTMRVRSKKLDAGLLDQIEAWIKKHPDARLIVIDTLGSVRGNSSDRRTLYEQDYEVGSALTKLAGEYCVAILIIHHLRKGDSEDPMDMISGSTGLTGGMDGAMVLTRTRNAADGILKAWHRDLEEDPEMALQKVEAGQGWWRYIGDAEEYQMGKERRKILDCLSNAKGPMKPMEIAEELGEPTQNVSKLLQKMREDGYVDNEGYGKYVLSKGTTPPSSIQVVQVVQVEPKVNGEVGPLGSLGPGLQEGEEF